MQDDKLPFVLQKCRKLPPEPLPAHTDAYDTKRQIWIDKITGRPLVELNTAEPSKFGETIVSKTSEGWDQPGELSTTFGETTFTKTFEGQDQSEGTLRLKASTFGETSVTATGEGTDQSEISSSLRVSNFGETSVTESGEGSDQSESFVNEYSRISIDCKE